MKERKELCDHEFPWEDSPWEHLSEPVPDELRVLVERRSNGWCEWPGCGKSGYWMMAGSDLDPEWEPHVNTVAGLCLRHLALVSLVGEDLRRLMVAFIKTKRFKPWTGER